MNLVQVLTKDEISDLKAKFAKWAKPSKNQYISFFAKLPDCTISVYSSGKVVFQGSEVEKYAGLAPRPKPKGQANLIGTDEVGNGSYFGGLIVVASFVRQEDLPFLRELGVDDSKKLFDDKIRRIAPELEKRLIHKSLIVSPEKYNEAITSGYNAVSIKVSLHNQAIFLLSQSVQAEAVVIDAFTTPANYQKYLKAEKNQLRQEVTLIAKAESQYLAVAASSIIARSLFLDQLDSLSLAAGLKLPSGAGSDSDQVAAKLVQSGQNLGAFAKLHFANTKKLYS